VKTFDELYAELERTLAERREGSGTVAAAAVAGLVEHPGGRLGQRALVGHGDLQHGVLQV
jgi:hypothetical protein